MKTSTLFTGCTALTLLAAGLAGLVNPDPGQGSARLASPLSGISDAIASWAVPEEETAVTRLPLPVRPLEQGVLRTAGTPAVAPVPGTPQTCLVIVDAPWLDSAADWDTFIPLTQPCAESQEPFRAIELIQIRRDRLRESAKPVQPGAAVQTKAGILRQRA